MKELWLTVKMLCLGFVFCGATAIASPAQFLTTLHSFDRSDGAYPFDGLLQATDGDFYGTTNSGSSGGVNNYGTAFKITPNGTLTTLHSFSLSGNDGHYPEAGLVQASDGNFYETTTEGGYDYYHYDGTVFRLVLPRPCIVCAAVQ